jgi:hypothetical protein
MANKLIEQMAKRDPKVKLTWQWKDISKPNCVTIQSDLVIKNQPESRWIQAVVRLHGKEVYSSFNLTNSQELKIGNEPSKTQEVLTYVILQHKMWVRSENWYVCLVKLG